MILIFGKQGQLARSFQASEPGSLSSQVVFVSSQEANFEQPGRLAGFLDHQGPRIVVCCAAYTQVDRAEEERDLASKINFEAPREIARWCAQNEALMIHFSTDYVFPGTGVTPWKETDPTGPVNWYGETKLQGEEAIRASGCRHLIFRTSWVVSEYGRNFIKTMLQLGRNRETLRVVSDQVGAPTYAPDLAEAVWGLILRVESGEALKSGVYHLAGQGETNWADFARAIFEEAGKLKLELAVKNVESIPTSQYPTPAHRPLNSRLDQSKARDALGVELPVWHKSLELCLKRIRSQG
jgi:dTDP-4-dehydrorhamnose reductase